MSFAQTSNSPGTSPRTLSYQGVISTTDGNKIAGEHLLTITIYADDQGKAKLWQSTMNSLLDNSGIFNCTLGTPDNPLPDAKTMDRPVWLGVSIDNNLELRPLTQMTASAYALNVADNAITTSKLADGAVTANKLSLDYVGGMLINGQPVATHGENINFQGGDGVDLTYDPINHTALIHNSGSEGGKGKGGTPQSDETVTGDLTVTGSTFFEYWRRWCDHGYLWRCDFPCRCRFGEQYHPRS